MPTLIRRRSLRRPLAALVASGALAGGLAACGAATSGSASGADPAGAVPAGAPVYVEAAVHPSDQQASNLDALAERLVGAGDPATRLAALVDRAGRERGISYARDVEPWLGDRAAIAMTDAGGGGDGTRDGDAVAVAASTDDRAAAAVLPKLAGAGARATTYRDVTVQQTADAAAAVLDGRVLAGAPQAVRAAIDAAKGQSLAETDGFGRARDDASGDGIGFAFVDVRALVRAASARAGAAGLVLAPLSEALPGVVGARVRAERDAFVVDAAARGGDAAAAAATGAGAADAVAALPASSWLGLGVAAVGKTLTTVLDDVGRSGLGALGVGQVEQQVRRATGLSLRGDLLSWMGDGALFVSGDRRGGIGGGLVVHSTDPAKSRRAVEALGGLLRATAQGARVRALHGGGIDAGWTATNPDGDRVVLAAAGDRVVLAYGREALAEALRPSRRLGDAAAFKAASARLGGGLRPSFWLDVPALARAHRGPDGAGHDGRSAQGRRALRALGPVVGGAQRDGDVTRAHVLVPVR